MSEPPSLQRFVPPSSRIPGISQAVAVDRSQRLLFLSGHVPLGPDGTVVGDDLAGQLDRALHSLSETLALAGSDFTHVVRITLYVRDYDASCLEEIRRVRDRWIDPDRAPASALIGVASLFHPDVRVEVDAVAVAS